MKLFFHNLKIDEAFFFGRYYNDLYIFDLDQFKVNKFDL